MNVLAGLTVLNFGILLTLTTDEEVRIFLASLTDLEVDALAIACAALEDQAALAA